MEHLWWIALAKAVELLLVVCLAKEYGKARSFAQLYELFAAQPELGRIGTITCVIIILAEFASALQWMVGMVAQMIS